MDRTSLCMAATRASAAASAALSVSLRSSMPCLAMVDELRAAWFCGEVRCMGGVDLEGSEERRWLREVLGKRTEGRQSKRLRFGAHATPSTAQPFHVAVPRAPQPGHSSTASPPGRA